MRWQRHRLERLARLVFQRALPTRPPRSPRPTRPPPAQPSPSATTTAPGITTPRAAAGGASAQAQTCNGPVNGGQTTISGLDPDTQYTITVYGECGGAAIASGDLFTAQNATQASLSVTSFDGTGATFTLEGWNQAWRLAQISVNSNSCIEVPAGTKSATVTGLTPGREYTYRAYDDTGNTCTAIIAGASVHLHRAPN